MGGGRVRSLNTSSLPPRGTDCVCTPSVPGLECVQTHSSPPLFFSLIL